MDCSPANTDEDLIFGNVSSKSINSLSDASIALKQVPKIYSADILLNGISITDCNEIKGAAMKEDNKKPNTIFKDTVNEEGFKDNSIKEQDTHLIHKKKEDIENDLKKKDLHKNVIVSKSKMQENDQGYVNWKNTTINKNREIKNENSNIYFEKKDESSLRYNAQWKDKDKLNVKGCGGIIVVRGSKNKNIICDLPKQEEARVNEIERGDVDNITNASERDKDIEWKSVTQKKEKKKHKLENNERLKQISKKSGSTGSVSEEETNAASSSVTATSLNIERHEKILNKKIKEFHLNKEFKNTGNKDPNSVFAAKPISPGIMDTLNLLCGSENSGIREGCRYYEQGITNLGNTCFLGSAIQLLLASNGFCYMLENLKQIKDILNSHKVPTLTALGQLATKLTPLPQNKYKQDECKCGIKRLMPIVPSMLTSVLDDFRKSFREGSNTGEQDAQEFLLFLLERVEKEIVQIKKEFEGYESRGYSQQEDNEGWLTVGPKQGVSVRRSTGIYHTSMLSSIFWGSIQSTISARGMVPSVTSHQFTILDLDIARPNIFSIEDALDLFTSKNSVQDYRIESRNQVTVASKLNLFQELPRSLLISLSRYVFQEKGMKKIEKNILLRSELVIKSKWMANKRKDISYKLVATCSHHGKGYGGDHYTASVILPHRQWVHYNDSVLQPICPNDVFYDQPYLLLYEKII